VLDDNGAPEASVNNVESEEEREVRSLTSASSLLLSFFFS